jgi:hypothetical protein
MSHSVVWENNTNVDVTSHEMSGKFDGRRRDLYPSGAALTWSDIDYYY